MERVNSNLFLERVTVNSNFFFLSKNLKKKKTVNIFIKYLLKRNFNSNGN